MTGQQDRPGFGKRGSVTADVIRNLPRAMQVEGILLLEEMGHSSVEVATRSGMSAAKRLELKAGLRPFQRHQPDFETGAQS